MSNAIKTTHGIRRRMGTGPSKNNKNNLLCGEIGGNKTKRKQL